MVIDTVLVKQERNKDKVLKKKCMYIARCK